MTVEQVREPIRVAVIFGPGRTITPVWFEWRRRKHAISQTTYTWSDTVGETTRLHFSVSDGEALYELVYSTADQSWNLLNLAADQTEHDLRYESP
ncbi:hypothetical protein [Trichlorobacter ammonificans]|uniref:Uncharacterized protein n=1 Tax=Trichlorobacter ammonificans TaxID=2916410 RepID=A0ABM9D799_9BACT|nr:hypothetical protein [Trichlorobacter ammonificans]CAH2030266.1 conserved protein of unknown function [Trichlorobacter ammonificans]